MTTLKDRLDAAAPHFHLRLRNPEADMVHRPDLAVWPDLDETGPNGKPIITIKVDPLWGMQTRFIDMTADEARQLARLLTTAADLADSYVEADDPASQQRNIPMTTYDEWKTTDPADATRGHPAPPCSQHYPAHRIYEHPWFQRATCAECGAKPNEPCKWHD